MTRPVRAAVAALLLSVMMVQAVSGQVAPPPARISCTDTTGAPGTVVALSARLMTADGTTPIPGQPIMFVVRGRELPGSPVLTDTDGLACLPYALSANTSGDALVYVAALAGCPTVGAEGKVLLPRPPTLGTITITAPRVCGAYSYVTVKAHAMGGSPVPFAMANLPLRLYIGAQRVGEATTNGQGDATFRWLVPARPSSGEVDLVAVSAGSPGKGARGSANILIIDTTPTTIAPPLFTSVHWGRYNPTIRLTTTFTRAPLADKLLRYYMDGQLRFELTTDANGCAGVRTDLPPCDIGVHEIVITYDGSTSYSSARSVTKLTVY